MEGEGQPSASLDTWRDSKAVPPGSNTDGKQVMQFINGGLGQCQGSVYVACG